MPLGLKAADQQQMQLFISTCLDLARVLSFAYNIISNKKMNDVIKIIKSLEEPGLLIKDVSEKIENKAKEQKGGFFGMLLGTLGASLLGNLLTGKEVIWTSQGRKGSETLATWANIPGRGTIRAGEGRIRAGQDF